MAIAVTDAHEVYVPSQVVVPPPVPAVLMVRVYLQTLLTVPDTAGVERAEVPDAFVASMV